MSKKIVPDHQRCTARSKQTQQRCGNYRVKGHLVCRFHGARSPAAIAKVAREDVERKISAAVAKLDITPVDNPLATLKALAGEVIAWKEAIKVHVLKLEQLRYEADMGGEQIRAEVVLFERALDRCASVLGLIAKLNIDDRLAQIEEAKVKLVVDAVEGALEALDIPVQEQAKAKAEVARRLRSVG